MKKVHPSDAAIVSGGTTQGADYAGPTDGEVPLPPPTDTQSQALQDVATPPLNPID
jgi:hypothetical protein